MPRMTQIPKNFLSAKTPLLNMRYIPFVVLYRRSNWLRMCKNLTSRLNCKPCGCSLRCCCDGLFLLSIFEGSDEHLLLWNPSTRESTVLSHHEISCRDCTYGFGYDATSDDYKILKIDENSPHDDKVPYEIFTLKSGSWRNIGNHPTGTLFVSPHMVPCIDSLAFVHGAFRWLGLSECIAMSDSGFTVVSFGVSNEVYGEIPLLEQMCYVSNSMSGRLVISVLGGILCFHSTHNPHGEGTFKLWVMKDYGVKESWTELFTIRETSIYPVRPIYMFGNGEMLLCCGLRFHYGSVFRTSKGPFGSWPQGYGDAYPSQERFAYIENLISPKLLSSCLCVNDNLC